MNSSINMKQCFGSTLKVIRIANQFELTKLCQKLDYSYSYGSQIEHGFRNPPKNYLIRFSEFFHYPIENINELDEFGKECNYHYQKMLFKVLQFYLSKEEK